MRRLMALALLLSLAACAGAQSRREAVAEMASRAGWSQGVLDAGSFELYAAWQSGRGAETLTVYLEGDGFAYRDATHPSLDPTPTDPLALRLALADSRSEAVAYLGRPCQYVMPAHGRGCSWPYWTLRRYAPEVVESASRAIDQLKAKAGAKRVLLVGYSGGGALAALLAARRQDVAALVTVAANLDLDYWTHRDGLSPLVGSLDPAQEAGRLGALPQLHFAGGKDRVVGADVTRSYLSHLPAGNLARLEVVPDSDHHCCWLEDWPKLRARSDLWPMPKGHD